MQNKSNALALIVGAGSGLSASLERHCAAAGMLVALAARNIDVAHFVIDGGILRAGGDSRAGARGEDGMLHPDAIAQTYLDLYRQHRSAWSFEVELRPWVEKF